MKTISKTKEFEEELKKYKKLKIIKFKFFYKE